MREVEQSGGSAVDIKSSSGCFAKVAKLHNGFHTFNAFLQVPAFNASCSLGS